MIRDNKDDNLITELKSLFYLIYIEDIYSISDLVKFKLIVSELERRGFDIYIDPKLSIRKRTNIE